MDKQHVNDKIDQGKTDPLDRLLQDKKSGSSGKGLAVLALLLALAAGAASGWQWWQAYSAGRSAGMLQGSVSKLQAEQQRLAQVVDGLKHEFDATATAVKPADFSRLRGRFQVLAGQLDALQGQLAATQASSTAIQGSVRSLEQRQSATETSLASVAAKSQNTDVELEIAEIDYLLRVANERLQLFADPLAADLALQAADVQLEALKDPLFLSVRQRIADARSALAAVPLVDRVQIAAQLAALQTKIPGLLFPDEAVSRVQVELPADAGWWENFKQTLASLVTIKRRVPDEPALLTIGDKDYLRQGLWLQLESARLAVMRHDSGAYRAALAGVSDAVRQFFQNETTAVTALQRELETLRNVTIEPEMPDISAPWLQLRQLRDSRRLLQSAAPIATEDSAE